MNKFIPGTRIIHRKYGPGTVVDKGVNFRPPLGVAIVLDSGVTGQYKDFYFAGEELLTIDGNIVLENK